MESKDDLAGLALGDRLSAMNMEQLRALFELRKSLLLEVRNEIDRREKAMGRPGVYVDFTKYVEDPK